MARKLSLFVDACLLSWALPVELRQLVKVYLLSVVQGNWELMLLILGRPEGISEPIWDAHRLSLKYGPLGWLDLSNVTSLSNLFWACHSKNESALHMYKSVPKCIENWDVSTIEDMSYLFYNAEFNEDNLPDLSKWASQVSQVSKAKGMFTYSFNNQKVVRQVIEGWKTAYVMNDLFA